MRYKSVKALLIASALAAATIAAAGCGKKEEEQVSVSAEVEQAAAYNFKGSDLDGYITGLENRTVLKGASFSQWFEGVKADPDIVKEVIADVGDADANTAGTYDVEVKVIVDAAALDEAVEEREAEVGEADGDTDGASTEGTGDSSGAGAGDAAQGTDTATGAGDTADGTEQVFISDNLEDIMVEVTTDDMADASTGEEAGGSLSAEEEAEEDYDPYEFTIDLSVEVVEEEQAAQIAAAGVYVDGYSTGERPAATTGVSGNSVAPSTSGNAATGNNTTATGNAGGSASNGSTSSGNGAATGNSGSSSKPSGGSSTGSSGNSGSSGSSSSRPSGGSGSSGSSGNSSSSGNSGSSGGSSQPSKPAHEHTWVAQYKTVHHDAVKEPQWVQVTEDYHGYACNQCGKRFGSDDGAAIYHNATSPGCGSYSWIDVDGDGYFEDVVIQEAYDEQVLTGYKCSGCGATK